MHFQILSLLLFSSMRIVSIIVIFIVWSCSPSPSPEPEILPVIPEIQERENGPSALDQGLMNTYDVYLFLKQSPSEKDVLITFGTPDSTWLDENDRVKIWYYYDENIQDYNSVEIDPHNGKVIGFEWD